MILTLDSPDAEPFEPKYDLKALIVYKDFKAAYRAKEQLERISRCCEQAGRLIYSMWNFDVMAVGSLCRMASKEAKAANLILIAASERDLLPGGVLKWFSLWRPGKQAHPKALAAILQPAARKSSGAEKSTGKEIAGDRGLIRSYLEMVARLDFLSFFPTGFDDCSDVELRSILSVGVEKHQRKGRGLDRHARRLHSRPEGVHGHAG